jgi:hypothetical protein
MFPRAALVILGLFLAAIATIIVIADVRLRAAEDSGKHVRVTNDIHFFGTQLNLYQTINGSLPTTEQGPLASVRLHFTL